MYLWSYLLKGMSVHIRVFTSTPTRFLRVCRDMKFLQFHSKARLLSEDNSLGLSRESGRILSNFWPVSIRWRGHSYSSVEHAFQAAKYLLASDRPEMAIEFMVGGKVGDDPRSAKKAGGKAGMARRGARLDIPRWNQMSEAVMREIVMEKARDPDVANILRICKKHQVVLFHYSRSDMKWGCHVDSSGLVKTGENLLGKILSEVPLSGKDVQ